jgi:aldehyde:ferredoxin oxidoreductase
LQAFLSNATGWDITSEKILRIGERIANLRQAFNVREGITPGDFKIRGRPVGDPPFKEGPTADITIDADTLRDEYFRAMDWDPQTGKPSKSKLEELGLGDVARELWP